MEQVMIERNIRLANENVPKPGEEWVMECKFAVESSDDAGGDWECNVGGSRHRKRVEFEGYATSEVVSSVMEAVRTIAGVPPYIVRPEEDHVSQ
jgi:hypothetical protein